MTITVEIYGRNMNVSDRITDYVTKKTERLERYLTGIDDARVDLAFVKTARNAADRQVAQITVRGKKFILRSEERADDVLAAFDMALSKMQRQIARYKGKRLRGRGDGKSLSQVVVEELQLEEELTSAIEEAPEIARRKQFVLAPMDELEAIEQMKLLGHENFFVFYNANTSQINVLYQRRDGKFGLIEPIVG